MVHSHAAPEPSYGRWQRVLNESWPPNPRDIKNRPAIAVTVRIVFERDGEQLLEAQAVRWTGRHVYCEVHDARLQATGAWVDAADVVRRGVDTSTEDPGTAQNMTTETD